MKIEFKDYIDFVRLLEGQILQTGTRRNFFTVSVRDDDLIFIPQSSMVEKFEPKHNITAVLKHFENTNSFTTVDYHDITFLAAYHVALLRLFSDNNKK